MELDENGYAPRDGLFNRLESEFALVPGAGAELFSDFRSRFPETCVPFSGVNEVLRELRASGYSLGLITNGSERTQGRKIEVLGLRDLMDVILISDVEGVRKPDPEIFARALARLGADASESVYIGDNPDADIRGAKGHGMWAIWFRDDFWEPPPDADAIVAELSEVPGVIGRLHGIS